jgi:TonB family protein
LADFSALIDNGKTMRQRAFHILRLVALVALPTILWCGCQSQLAFEGNPMPAQQVDSFLEVISPRSVYDTPPKFVKGYAPFFPEGEPRTRHLGYALAEFTINPDGRATHVRILKATTMNFAEEAGYTVRDWRFSPAKKNGQPVPVRARLPFTFRES